MPRTETCAVARRRARQQQLAARFGLQPAKRTGVLDVVVRRWRALAEENVRLDRRERVAQARYSHLRRLHRARLYHQRFAYYYAEGDDNEAPPFALSCARSTFEELRLAHPHVQYKGHTYVLSETLEPGAMLHEAFRHLTVFNRYGGLCVTSPISPAEATRFKKQLTGVCEPDRLRFDRVLRRVRSFDGEQWHVLEASNGTCVVALPESAAARLDKEHFDELLSFEEAGIGDLDELSWLLKAEVYVMPDGTKLAMHTEARGEEADRELKYLECVFLPVADGDEPAREPVPWKSMDPRLEECYSDTAPGSSSNSSSSSDAESSSDSD